MRTITRLPAVALFLLAGFCGSAHAAGQAFSVVAHGETVGTLDATFASGAVQIAYQVRNNGRGPTIQESLRVQNGFPREWTVRGTTAFGGKVDESMSFDGAALRWTSQADQGEIATRAPMLYVSNDGSPWSLGLFARALLAAPGQALDVAPSGRMQLTEMGVRRFGDVEARVHALKGIDLSPDYVLLDRKRDLFAVVRELGEVVIRKGYEMQAATVLAAVNELASAQLERDHAALARRYDRPVRLRNVRIFDPRSGRTGEPVSVVFFRGRIASVAPESSAPADVSSEVIVDGQGGTVIPGLHDMHSHNSPSSGLYYLAAGVTNVRDVGNDNDELLELQSRIDGGHATGPRIWRSGLIEGRSPYSARLGRIADTLPQAIDHVRWYADRGYLGIKIYNSLNPDWVKPVAAEAHRFGMHVHGHVPAFMTPDRAIEDGYDELTHINQLALGWILKPEEDTRTPIRLTALGERARDIDLASAPVRHTIELMQSHKTALDPTLVILERLMLSRSGQVAPGDVAYLDHMPIGYQRYRKRSFVNFKAPEEDAAYRQSFQRLVELIGTLHRAGITLLPGTDDVTGFTVHRELELYVQAGIPAPTVLRMATLDCETYLGRDQQLGTVEPGKRADFVVLAADPTQDIGAVRKARLVVKDDELYQPSEIYRTLGIRPFVEPLELPAAGVTQ